MYKSEMICGFYISESHLTTMLIPYIYKKIKEGSRIETFFEEDLEDIFSNINLENTYDREIFKAIDWKKLKSEELSSKFEGEKNIIIVAGKSNFISHINRLVLNFHTNFTLVNCYNVKELNRNISSIIEEYGKVLYTSGIEEVGETFMV